MTSPATSPISAIPIKKDVITVIYSLHPAYNTTVPPYESKTVDTPSFLSVPSGFNIHQSYYRTNEYDIEIKLKDRGQIIMQIYNYTDKPIELEPRMAMIQLIVEISKTADGEKDRRDM